MESSILRDTPARLIRWRQHAARYNAKGEQTHPAHVELALAVEDTPELVSLLATVIRRELPLLIGLEPGDPQQTRLELAD